MFIYIKTQRYLDVKSNVKGFLEGVREMVVSSRSAGTGRQGFNGKFLCDENTSYR